MYIYIHTYMCVCALLRVLTTSRLPISNSLKSTGLVVGRSDNLTGKTDCIHVIKHQFDWYLELNFSINPLSSTNKAA